MLAVATFAAVRSSNRSSRVAEIALQEQRRPLLAGSRLNVDPEQKIMFVDEHIPAGDVGLWQGAIRDRGDPAYDELVPIRREDADGTTRLVSVARHWYLDRVGPR